MSPAQLQEFAFRISALSYAAPITEIAQTKARWPKCRAPRLTYQPLCKALGHATTREDQRCSSQTHSDNKPRQCGIIARLRDATLCGSVRSRARLTFHAENIGNDTRLEAQVLRAVRKNDSVHNDFHILSAFSSQDLLYCAGGQISPREGKNIMQLIGDYRISQRR